MHYILELKPVCRKCIYEKLSDEEADCCPVCNIDLGCLPVEKLRLVPVPYLYLSPISSFSFVVRINILFIFYILLDKYCRLIHEVVVS